MIASRKQELSRKIFSPDNLLPETHEFETALTKRGDLHRITFQLLWQKLNAIKTEEIEQKLVLDEKAYIHQATKYAMQAAPKILALLKVLTSEKINRTKEEVRDKIIESYQKIEDTNQLITTLQSYFSGIKTNRSTETKDILLDTTKLNKALAAPSNVGVLWGNDYSSSEESFYQKLAILFHKLNRIEFSELAVSKLINQQMQSINKLRTDLDTTLITNPIVQLETILSEYKIELKDAVEKYKTSGQQANMQLATDSVKIRTKKIVADYKKSIANIKEKINHYPQCFETALIKSIKDSKDRNAELINLKKLLITRKNKLQDECAKLDTQLANELGNNKDSKKQLLMNEIHNTAIPIRQEELPDVKRVEIAIAALQLKVSDAKQLTQITCESLLTYQTKINKLADDIIAFCNQLQNQRKIDLKKLIEDLEKSFKEFKISATYISEFNYSDSKLLPPINQFLDNSTGLIPLKLVSLHNDIEHNSSEIITQFDKELKATQFSFRTKKSEREHLINDIARELKLNITSQIKSDELLQHLPELIKQKTAKFKIILQELKENAEKEITAKNRATLLQACRTTLTEFDSEIKNLQTDAKIKDLQTQLNEKNIDTFLATIAKNISEEEAATDLEKKRQLAVKAQQKLDEAKNNEEKARIGVSPQTLAAAERERILAEKHHALARLHAQESEKTLTHIRLSPITTPKEPPKPNYVAGFFAGLGSMLGAPIAWFYGAYRFGKEIKLKYQSTGWGIFAGLAAFLIMPIAWFFGGVRLGQKASGEIDSSQTEECRPLLNLDSPTIPKKISIAPIVIPSISPIIIQEQFKEVCARKNIEFKSSKTESIIATHPKQLVLTDKADLLIKDTKENIRFSNAAKTLMCHILDELNHKDDLRLDINKEGFISLDIKAGNRINHFYLSAKSTMDFFYVYDRDGSATKSPLEPMQYEKTKLKNLLYQNPTPENNRKGSANKESAPTPERRFNFKI